jgi:hypothetical protein
MGISDDTSQTRDTRPNKKAKESTTSLVDQLKPKDRKRLFNFKFIRDSVDCTVNYTHLDTLKKTVNSIY